VKCKKCGGRATLELRRHNTAYCADDYLVFFRHQVLETIRKWRMFPRDEAVLVAVSGGKDSLALWDVLLRDGYATTGLYIDLGIGDYSRESRARCEAFASQRDARLLVVPVADLAGAGISVPWTWETVTSFSSFVPKARARMLLFPWTLLERSRVFAPRFREL
jgi:hypothetical protein